MMATFRRSGLAIKDEAFRSIGIRPVYQPGPGGETQDAWQGGDRTPPCPVFHRRRGADFSSSATAVSSWLSLPDSPSPIGRVTAMSTGRGCISIGDPSAVVIRARGS